VQVGAVFDLETIGVGAAAALAGVFAERIFGRPFDRGIFKLQSRLNRAGHGPPSLSGIWHTRYTYESSNREGTLEDEYLIVLKQGRSGIRGKSLKRAEGSSLSLDLALDHSVLSGTWAEYTPAQQRTYHGTCQLILNAPGDVLEGKWLGFRSDDLVEVGPWHWRRLDRSIGRRERKRYISPARKESRAEAGGPLANTPRPPSAG
jgi:hypothetical protein